MSGCDHFFFFYISNISFGNFILRVAELMELLSLILKYELRIFVDRGAMKINFNARNFLNSRWINYYLQYFIISFRKRGRRRGRERNEDIRNSSRHLNKGNLTV